jgi:GntR family transcriptional repressor for pyruvate dehydrogenase complex
MKTKTKTSWRISGSNINRQTLYEQVADSLEEMILNNESDDKRLPSEMDLVAQFGVSRSVIREALKALKERGLISLRAGGGSYITMPESGTISRAVGRITQFHDISDEKITKVRMILESAAAAEAAKYVTQKDIKKLTETVDQMELCKDDIEKRVQKDCEFHYLVASISRNELLAFMVQSIMDILQHYIKTRLQKNPIAGHESGLQWHRQIIKDIASHNQELARKHMTAHIEKSFHELD